MLQFLAIQNGLRAPLAPVAVPLGAPLRDVLRTMVDNQVHHVYVVPPPAEGRVRAPLGVVTPTDVLFLFDVGPPEAGVAAAAAALQAAALDQGATR